MDPRALSPEEALELARISATTARELARTADEQLAQALARYNRREA